MVDTGHGGFLADPSGGLEYYPQGLDVCVGNPRPAWGRRPRSCPADTTPAPPVSRARPDRDSALSTMERFLRDGLDHLAGLHVALHPRGDVGLGDDAGHPTLGVHH